MDEEIRRDYNRKPGSEIQGSYRLTKAEAARLAALLESLEIKPTNDNIKKVVRWLITQFDKADPEDIKRLFISEYPRYHTAIVALEKAAMQIADKRRGIGIIKARGALQLDLLRKASEFAVVEDALKRGESTLEQLRHKMCSILYYAALEFLYDRDEAVFNDIVARYAARVGLSAEEALVCAVAKWELRSSMPLGWRQADAESSYQAECEAIESALAYLRRRKFT
ncbi:hypothetical protein EPA93_21670 [Ktedonosporobacter rubrisoli]|uniref:Uncharacterized protein n=1 Tax=Ktedonosporobacter rubrisoli TaxID=2509675 RepID=A0A4V0YZ47_KTERU|nr:hypothetical protein [Ktedonosporobacter rubrisoli]QBD78461.1 hypothetical protein EPA93_21670 [Ktedonosporobacter rubrisoli]